MTKNTQTDNFAAKAGSWDNPSKIDMTNKFVAALLEKVNPEKDWNVLEIGAGTGLVALQLLPLVNSITFEDTSEAMLSELQSKLKGDENVNLFHGEVTEISEGSFDFAVSCMAFHHIPNLQNTLKHIHQITKPGAIVAIGDIHTEDGSFHHFDPIPHTGFDTEKLSEIFEENGFKTLSVSDYNVLTRERTPGIFSDYTQFLLIAERK
ncbi:MAG: class I SAM-dependent methyltransferase [Paludibacteraceae bacterium]|nr:class I SAM-dependent methyltransferase [Paludibacteraceae bacterium]